MEKLNLDNNTNPNTNFEHFIELSITLKQQCLPKREVKFNRKKHKIEPWLTASILNSINYEDKTIQKISADSKRFTNLRRYILQL